MSWTLVNFEASGGVSAGLIDVIGAGFAGQIENCSGTTMLLLAGGYASDLLSRRARA
jgi:hypothetical protein